MRFLIRSFSELKNDSATALSAVATPAHARGQVISPAEALPVVTAVLAALV
jgi:hypothetical protein